MLNPGQVTLWKVFLLVFIFIFLLYLNLFDLYALDVFRSLCQLIGVTLVLIHISWLLTQFFRRYAQLEYIPPKNRAVLITGCDSGFGHQVCYKLDSYGFHVFAGVLFPDSENADKLRVNCSKRLKVVKLDVTNVEDVKNVVKEIEASNLELWAVLNNAGISYYSLIEMGNDVEVFEKIFSVNVFGLVRVTKYCLPLLRKSGGRVVNMSSIAGRFSFWGITAYCMSKFAVRSFSDGLRREMSRFGVKVVTIEPNLYRTGIMDVDILSKSIDQIWDKTDEKVRNDYGGEKFLDKLKARMKLNTIISRPQIHEVTDAQEEAITLCEPELYYRCSGLGERPALWALGHVSDSAQDFALTGSVWKRILLLFKTK